MNANFASIMPQVVAVWCKKAGHDVSLLCYTGFEDCPKSFRRISNWCSSVRSRNRRKSRMH